MTTEQDTVQGDIDGLQKEVESLTDVLEQKPGDQKEPTASDILVRLESLKAEIPQVARRVAAEDRKYWQSHVDKNATQGRQYVDSQVLALQQDVRRLEALVESQLDPDQRQQRQVARLQQEVETLKTSRTEPEPKPAEPEADAESDEAAKARGDLERWVVQTLRLNGLSTALDETNPAMEGLSPSVPAEEWVQRFQENVNRLKPARGKSPTSNGGRPAAPAAKPPPVVAGSRKAALTDSDILDTAMSQGTSGLSPTEKTRYEALMGR